jgi:hypothetical protein
MPLYRVAPIVSADPGVLAVAVLLKGDWYHRRGVTSDLCKEEFLKLSTEQQAEYVEVETIADLGEQVRCLPFCDLTEALTADPRPGMDLRAAAK